MGWNDSPGLGTDGEKSKNINSNRGDKNIQTLHCKTWQALHTNDTFKYKVLSSLAFHRTGPGLQVPERWCVSSRPNWGPPRLRPSLSASRSPLCCLANWKLEKGKSGRKENDPSRSRLTDILTSASLSSFSRAPKKDLGQAYKKIKK